MSCKKFCYINLDKRKDRQDFLEKQLRHVCGDKLQCFSAVSAKEVEEKEGVYMFNDTLKLTLHQKTKVNILSKQRFYHSEIDNWAQVACAYSHITLWTEMVEDKSLSENDVWIIFEDDIVVCQSQWINQLPEVLEEMRKNEINVFMLNVIPREPEREIATTEKTKYLCELRKFWGAHAYFFTKSGAKGLIQYLEKHCHSQINEQVDAMIYNANKLKYIKAGAMQRKYKWFRQDEKQFGTDVQIIWNPNLKD